MITDLTDEVVSSQASADQLSWELVKYRDAYADLQATDKDHLEG